MLMSINLIKVKYAEKTLKTVVKIPSNGNNHVCNTHLVPKIYKKFTLFFAPKYLGCYGRIIKFIISIINVPYRF